MSRAVFLDRDGVINKLVYNPNTSEYESPHFIDNFEFQDEAMYCLKTLQSYDYKLFLVSNQPSYAKGKTTLENIKSIHEKMLETLRSEKIAFEDYYYCYHHPDGVIQEYTKVCDCRKPSPYFILTALERYQLDKVESWFIGDQDSDILCGSQAGLQTILILNDHSKKKRGQSNPDHSVMNLQEAVKIVIEKTKGVNK